MKTFGKDHWTYKHGGTVNRKSTPEYSTYRNARSRCRNPNAPNYAYYGGRGIEFRFESFEQFFAELGPKPSPKHSIERIKNDRHYEPGNVRWATRTEQTRNLRSNVLLTWQGQTLCIRDWEKITGLSYNVIRRRKQVLKWCDECCLTRPYGISFVAPEPCKHEYVQNLEGETDNPEGQELE